MTLITDVVTGRALSFVLFPHQTRARALARDAFRSGKRAILYVAPTGAGKTVILGDTIASHLRNLEGARVNVYAHRRELLTQAARTFRSFGLDVGIFGEGARHPVQVLSTQGALAKGEVNACTLAVFDEAHHYASDEWKTVLDAHREAGATVCGATATPERADGRALDFFDHIVVVAQPRELVASGALVPCEVIKPSRPVPKGKIAESPAVAYRRFAQGRRAIVFAPNIRAAEDFAKDFVKSVVVHGKLSADERDHRFKLFESGQVPVLVNVAIATEGYDCPAADVCILARDCGSTGLFLQCVGRVMRPAPGKKDCLLIDLRGTSEAHGHPQEDREYSLEGIGISSSGAGLAGVLERLCRLCKKPLDENLVCTGCGRDHTPGTPEAAGIALERWAGKRRDDDDARIAQLARWFAKFPGRKSWFYMYRYKAVYSHTPPGHIWREAQRQCGEKNSAGSGSGGGA